MSKALEIIRPFPLLAGLDDAELEVVLRHADEVALGKGEYLFREGDPGDALYLLYSGVLVAERVIDPAAGTRKDLAIIPANTFVGEMALADSSPRSASVRAEIPARALRLSRAAFEQVMNERPVVASKIFRALFAETAQRLRVTNEELVALYETGGFVATAANPKLAGEMILKRLALRLAAGYVLVALYDPTLNQLRVAHALGSRGPEILGRLIPLDDGLPKSAYDQKKALLVERMLGATEPWESESMLLVPLVVKDRAVGLLLLGAREGRPYALDDLSLATAVANISAPVLQEALSA